MAHDTRYFCQTCRAWVPGHLVSNGQHRVRILEDAPGLRHGPPDEPVRTREVSHAVVPEAEVSTFRETVWLPKT